MRETIEGYVADIGCMRGWPQHDLLKRAAAHSIECAHAGVETGYGLVDADGRLHLLDPAATPMVQRALRETDREKGVLLRVARERADGSMMTHSVELAIVREPVESSNIQSVGYQDGVLEIEFSNGIYQFLDVPYRVYDELMGAASHGRYFNAHVKNHFQSRRM